MMIMIMVCWWCGQQCANKTFLYNKKENEKVSLFSFLVSFRFGRFGETKTRPSGGLVLVIVT